MTWLRSLAAPLGTDPPRPGALVLRHAGGKAAASYYIYVPTRAVRAGAGLLVSVHGISRNAREHGQALAHLAERHGVVLLSPLFARDFYPDFQRLGIESRCHPHAALEAMIEDASAFLSRSFERFSLFGYSAGGQFAHRYALLRPQRVANLAVAAPGWYTWPNAERRFPYGLRSRRELAGLSCDLDAFLRIPLCALVGAKDTARDGALRCSRWIDSRQGRTRIERTQAWFAELQRVAAERGVERRARLHVLPHSGHDFLGNVRRDRMDAHVFEFFYEATSTGA